MTPPKSTLTLAQPHHVPFGVMTLAQRQGRPRPLRRVPLRGVDDPPRASPSEMQPSHPADSSSRSPPSTLADARLRRRRPTPTGPLDARDARRRRRARHRPPLRPEVGGDRQRRLAPRSTDAELDAIEAFVRGGGGLIVLGETEQEKYGNNLNDLLARFGIEIENATVQDYEHHHGDAPSWVLADARRRPGPRRRPPAPTCSPASTRACFYRAGTLALHNGGRVIARTLADRLAARARPLAAVAEPRRRPRRRRSPTPTCSATTASASSTTRPSG